MIRGTKRPRVKAVEIIEPEAQKIDAQLNASIHNRFDIEVIDAKTGQAKQKAYAENVICDTLWTKMFTASGSNYFQYIHYGTGSGTPSSSDTALFTYLGYGTPSTSNDAYDEMHLQDGYFSFTRKIQLREMTAVGSTLTEVGIAYGTSSGLVTHAMLKDMNGNAISIAKTSTDIINIYGTVFVHWDTSTYQTDLIGLNFVQLVNNSVENSFFTWFVGMLPNLYNNNAVEALHGGNCDAHSARKALTITGTAATKTLQAVMARAAVSEFNFTGGIGAISCFEGPSYNGSFMLYVGGSWYPGTNITAEAIGTGDGTTTDFSTDFGFVSSGAKIYLNGVEQTSGVTIDEGHPLENTNMGLYFIGLYAMDYLGAPFDSISSPTQQRTLGSPGQTSSSYTMVLKGWANTYYNPNYAKGISQINYLRSCKLEVSNDGSTWVELSNSTSILTSFTIPAAYQYYKYWRFTGLNLNYNCAYGFVSATGSAKNIHFTTAPTLGAVITADYTTKMIAKDTNHVFDLTVTITLGEYIE